MQNNSNITLIIDVGPQSDGKLKDRAFLMSISHTLMPIHELVRDFEQRGIPCITPDAFLKSPQDFVGRRVLLMSALVSDRTPHLIEKGAEPFLLMCQESPFIATRFYIDFTRISETFTYTMGFSGMRKKASSHTTFLTMHFPVYVGSNVREIVPFSNRKSTVLIAGNKAANWIKTLPLKFNYGASVRLIYPLRKKVVAMLAKHEMLDIYGRGWDTDTEEAVRKSYRGPAPADAKEDILRNYKFTLAFENVIFPGYVTEKIFDAMLARSVPVYLGDPEITGVVPKTCFIDVRDFADLDALRTYLEEMSEDHYNEYLAAIDAFLASDTFKRFTHRAFIHTVYDLINK